MEQSQRHITRETTRIPIRFQQRVINQFNSPENYEYLYHLLDTKIGDGGMTTPSHGKTMKNYMLNTLWGDMQMFAAGDGPIYDFTDSDNIANRASLNSALDLWSEVRRINLIFFENQMNLLHNQNIQPPPPLSTAYNTNWNGPVYNATQFTGSQYKAGFIPPLVDGQLLVPTIRDGISEDDESYEMRAFISDSLQPPGLEYLNGPGPKFELLEDQSTWIRDTPMNSPFNPPIKKVHWGDQKDNFQAQNLPLQSQNSTNDLISEFTSMDINDDIPWSTGNPNRSAEQAIAEYWGDNKVSSDTIIGSTEFAGVTDGDITSWGRNWKKNNGSAFMRYKTIPFWQKGGREGMDYYMDEGIGGMFDTDTHVRGWNMDKLTKSKGQNYIAYGMRSGPVV